MTIETRIKRSYTLRMVIIAVVCIVLGLWGAYDFFIRYPGDNALYARYIELEQRKTELDEKLTAGRELTDDEVKEYDAAAAFLAEHLEQPTQHSQLNIWFQWAYISCLPFGVWMLWTHWSLSKKRYRLEEDGTLHTPVGAFAAAQIRDIDMKQWMAKSIAWVETTDDQRIKLDDYIHQDMHLIVGALAHERHPDEWHADAKPVRMEPPPPSTDGEGDAEARAGDEPPRVERADELAAGRTRADDTA